MIRVIGGKARGIRLKVPKGRTTRPTADRVRESIFNILGPRVEEAVVLDLYAGTGALGIEALSRGALHATFVERDRRVAAVLRENIAKGGFAEQSLVIVTAVPPGRALEPSLKPRFDLVFIDPPYDRAEVGKALDWLDRSQATAEGAILVVEHSLTEEIPSSLTNFERVREERYNGTRVSFLRARM